jgi:hypothetical protein
MANNNDSNNDQNKPKVVPVVPQTEKKPLPEGINKTPSTIIINENNKATNQEDNTKKSQVQSTIVLMQQLDSLINTKK